MKTPARLLTPDSTEDRYASGQLPVATGQSMLKKTADGTVIITQAVPGPISEVKGPDPYPLRSLWKLGTAGQQGVREATHQVGTRSRCAFLPGWVNSFSVVDAPLNTLIPAAEKR